MEAAMVQGRGAGYREKKLYQNPSLQYPKLKTANNMAIIEGHAMSWPHITIRRYGAPLSTNIIEEALLHYSITST